MIAFSATGRTFISGGTGAIGTELARILVEEYQQPVTVYSRSETRQWEMSERLPGETLRQIKAVCGDVRDYQRVSAAMEGADIVYHLAAMRHVDFCEANAVEAVEIGVRGLENVLQAAQEHRVKAVVFTSTAEAVAPGNVYGYSKAVCERMMWQAHLKRGKDCAFITTRFPNILGGKGAFIPRMLLPVARGEVIKLHHPEMRRMLMTIPQAARLLERAITYPSGSVVFRKAQWAYIRDVLRTGARLKGLEARIEVGEPREGQTLFTQLISAAERHQATENTEHIFIDRAGTPPKQPVDWQPAQMTADELTQFIEEVYRYAA